MSLFPDLDLIPLHNLMDLFSSDYPYQLDPEEREIWLQEVAVKIAKAGSEGVSFLIRNMPCPDRSKQRAILLAFSFIPEAVVKERSRELSELLVAFLGEEDPVLVAEAIDSLKVLGYPLSFPDILPFVNHQSPFVIGSALRYLSRFYPHKAKLLLLKALRSPEPIVRQNAVDELDELGWRAAIPYLRVLLNDPDQDVREAARTALENLENGTTEE
jgi:hypothetical protein